MNGVQSLSYHMYARAFVEFEATKRIKTKDNEFIRASTRKRSAQHSGTQLNAGRVNDSVSVCVGQQASLEAHRHVEPGRQKPRRCSEGTPALLSKSEAQTKPHCVRIYGKAYGLHENKAPSERHTLSRCDDSPSMVWGEQ